MRIKLFSVLCTAVLSTACVGCSRFSMRELAEASRLTGGGNAIAGRDLVRKYGCNTCHTIGRVPGARGLVGPPLNGISERSYIAGELPNTPANLMYWIRHPHGVEPRTVMPEMNVTEDDSRDIAAFLFTLR
jgi:cytochrome c